MDRVFAKAHRRGGERAAAPAAARVARPAPGTRATAVGRLVTAPRVQAKLRIGAPDDVYEREADQVADRVMRTPEPAVQRMCTDCEEEQLQRQPLEEEEEMLQTKPLVQRMCAECEEEQLQRQPMEEEEEEILQTKPLVQRICTACAERETVQTKPGSVPPRVAPPVVQNVLRTAGNPLGRGTRSSMEQRFGHDFGQVRVHSDGPAAASARAIQAEAYTVGNHVVFGRGRYRPGTAAGDRLLAHELTHTIQQSSSAPLIQRAVSNEYSRGNDDTSECSYETARITGEVDTDVAGCAPNGSGIAVTINYTALLAGNPRDLQPLTLGPRFLLVEVGTSPANQSATLSHTANDPPAGPPGDTLTAQLVLSAQPPCEGGSVGGQVNVQAGSFVQQELHWAVTADSSGVQDEQIRVDQLTPPGRSPTPMMDITAGQSPYPDFPGQPRTAGRRCDPTTGREVP